MAARTAGIDRIEEITSLSIYVYATNQTFVDSLKLLVLPPIHVQPSASAVSIQLRGIL